MIKVSCHKLIVTDKLHMAETCFFHRGHKTRFLFFFFFFLTSTQNSHNSILRLFFLQSLAVQLLRDQLGYSTLFCRYRYVGCVFYGKWRRLPEESS